MTICKIRGDYIQLNQFLKKENVASSGGEAKVMIQNQMVSVNGSIAFEIRKKLKTRRSSQSGGRGRISVGSGVESEKRTVYPSFFHIGNEICQRI